MDGEQYSPGVCHSADVTRLMEGSGEAEEE